MLMTTLLLGGPPLVTNFFSGAVAATFSAYNPMGQMAAGRPVGSPEEMMATRGSVGVNTQENTKVPTNADSNVRVTQGYQTNTPSTPPATGKLGIANKEQ